MEVIVLQDAPAWLADWPNDDEQDAAARPASSGATPADSGHWLLQAFAAERAPHRPRGAAAALAGRAADRARPATRPFYWVMLALSLAAVALQ